MSRPVHDPQSPVEGRADAFRGSIVSLPTPFQGGAVDLAALDRLVAFHARSRSDAIALGGTTGEGWSLNLDETVQVVSRAVEAAAHHSSFRMRVMLCIAEVDSRRAAQIAGQAADVGIDGLFVSAPSHVRVGEAGLLRHLQEIQERVPARLGVAIHNEPKRTGSDFTAGIIQGAAERFPAVVAHCEGVGYPGRARGLAAELDLPVLGGDDRMIGPFVRSGAAGILSIVGNIVPAEIAQLIGAILADRFDADSRERALAPLIDALRSATNPIALKECLGALGAIEPDVRPPLAPLTPAERSDVHDILCRARLLVPAEPAPPA